ncbi:tRNA (Uracil-5)-methyltransferase [Lasiodiplodia theobromae]|uniref:tRNA (uracil(54)-C(5))-methyltransferase n=1 Tax=Lasiodiplodia theobromae TaxID=45133 RepID=A0A5N5CZI4_9PEZI|nr:tRNA (Uracil-5)-methyltransferase [Lasiodiplodia theobromae]KAB2570737.1 tRNA (uracil(54)-C(5))-methyltransferase [Lasiodiplodia theobromae]KAF4535143.1 tRNA (Uracil-5)-methyltransferase [Lasiodiplodia theobromae]
MASPANNVAPVESNGRKRAFEGARNYRFKKQKKEKDQKQSVLKTEGTHEEVLLKDVEALLRKHSIIDTPSEPNAEANGESSPASLPDPFTEVELTVQEISSTGDGLALAPNSNQVFVVPFTTPGDKVKAKVVKHFTKERYTLTDFIQVLSPGSLRNDSLVNCKYFSSCSGCQFQMLPYEAQLAHKKTIVEKAYKNFSDLAPELVPAVADTIGSPLQFGYRTKLTPHFDGPPGKKRSDGRHGIRRKFEQVPPIGFMKKGTRQTLDIEDCPIGTDAVRMGMQSERKRVAVELDKYSKGATILLRESTKRLPKDPAPQPRDDAILEDRGAHFHEKTCVTDQKGRTTEYIDDFKFENPAGAFFQNNNSILPKFTQYIRDRILPRGTDPADPDRKIKHLIDAYSGSGLFTITLSQMFKKSLGIDISSSSIEFASTNARLNNLAEDHAAFIAADAANLFASIETPADETVVVIDPPRKGCDDLFLRQLLRYSPARVVYVSCNVHTQARDVGILVNGMEGVDGGFGPGKGVYEIESLVGFDFFPQTGHVEGVAVLQRRNEAAPVEVGRGA